MIFNFVVDVLSLNARWFKVFRPLYISVQRPSFGEPIKSCYKFCVSKPFFISSCCRRHHLIYLKWNEAHLIESLHTACDGAVSSDILMPRWMQLSSSGALSVPNTGGRCYSIDLSCADVDHKYRCEAIKGTIVSLATTKMQTADTSVGFEWIEFVFGRPDTLVDCLRSAKVHFGRWWAMVFKILRLYNIKLAVYFCEVLGWRDAKM